MPVSLPVFFMRRFFNRAFFICAEHFFKITEKARPVSRCGVVTGDQHIIMAAACPWIKALAGGCTHAPPRPAAHDGIAHFAAGGKTQSWRCIIMAVSDLHDHRWRDKFLAMACRGEKVASFR